MHFYTKIIQNMYCSSDRPDFAEVDFTLNIKLYVAMDDMHSSMLIISSTAEISILQLCIHSIEYATKLKGWCPLPFQHRHFWQLTNRFHMHDEIKILVSSFLIITSSHLPILTFFLHFEKVYG